MINMPNTSGDMKYVGICEKRQMDLDNYNKLPLQKHAHATTGASPILHLYAIPHSPLIQVDKHGAIGPNSCHLPEAVTSVSHV